MSFEYAFLKRIFLRGKIKLLKEVNDREVKANFEKKAVLAIDSLDRVYMSYVYIYIYMRGIYIHVHGGVDSYIMLIRTEVIGHKVEASNQTGFLENQIREQLISKK